jgi:hypothetical protein
VCTMLVLVALAIAGLMHPVHTTVVMEPHYESAATILALDISKSQRAESGYYENPEGRLGATKSAVLQLLSAQKEVPRAWWQLWERSLMRHVLKGQRIGVSVFAGQAYTLTTPTDRHDTIRNIVKKHVFVNDAAVQGTNFAAAIEESLASFEESDLVRTIILITDGEEDAGVSTSLETVLAHAREMHVKIFTVVVGHGRAKVPGLKDVWSEPDMATPRHIALRTGGKAFAYDELGKLYPALEEIFENVEETAKRPVPYEHDLRPWLAFAFLVLFVTLIFFQFVKK